MHTPSLDGILARITQKFPGTPDAPPAALLVKNPLPTPGAQDSLLLSHETAVEVAKFLRDAPEFQLDYCSNVTGLDNFDPKKPQEGYLEAVYHLYSIKKKFPTPVILRLRTRNRDIPELAPDGRLLDAKNATVPSLTPVWRSCEFQEREAYDLFGIVFLGHPDLRRLLMWDEFQDFPMRKDYVEPDDYEWEPTPHAPILEKARKHWPARKMPSPVPAPHAHPPASNP
ncbi:MAG: NADH-quinone oxidoreductase subunit C [Puniceicoccales bacterium]|jgi:NADH-quinone oxidoreductase subunit C|nr:NADH-quinone oxidoreductase subunit C [Puniceicoccales bacterium]